MLQMLEQDNLCLLMASVGVPTTHLHTHTPTLEYSLMHTEAYILTDMHTQVHTPTFMLT